MRTVAAEFGADFEADSLDGWTNPALVAIRARRQVHLEWAMLCRNRTYPVFAMTFDFDPRVAPTTSLRPLTLC